MKPETMSVATRAYLECALWSSCDDDGDPLDRYYHVGDFAPEAVRQAAQDVEAFEAENEADIDASGLDSEQVGYLFWLNRNGHGAGFWDRGLGAVGSRLSEACRPYGSSDCYVGDDGAVYLT